MWCSGTSYGQAKSGRGQLKVTGRPFVVVEYNVENLFDCEHDSLKDDLQYTPDGASHWTHGRYWRKLNAVARALVAAGTDGSDFVPPALIGLCEVENDSVLYALTHRSLLRGARYEYVMTNSPDRRGVDVALLYSPFSFRLTEWQGLRVDTLDGMRPTRDILYAKGEIRGSQRPLHVFVVHAPSRSGGERPTRPFRMHVMHRLMAAVDSLRHQDSESQILIMGDFNDYSDSPSLHYLVEQGFVEVSEGAMGVMQRDEKGRSLVCGTYRYQGAWGSLDHVMVSQSLSRYFAECYVVDDDMLVEKDQKYGGVKPRRSFLGAFSREGFSDHLPLRAAFRFGE